MIIFTASAAGGFCGGAGCCGGGCFEAAGAVGAVGAFSCSLVSLVAIFGGPPDGGRGVGFEPGAVVLGGFGVEVAATPAGSFRTEPVVGGSRTDVTG